MSELRYCQKSFIAIYSFNYWKDYISLFKFHVYLINCVFIYLPGFYLIQQTRLPNKYPTSIRQVSDKYLIIQLALHKKMKFSIKDFFSKCDQNRRKPRFGHIY